MNLDVSEIVPSVLYQGAAPPQGTVLRALGVDALFLCAQEHQPSSGAFPGVSVHRCPMLDMDPALPSDLQDAEEASRIAEALVRRGKRVLITCWAGRNRSALVMGLTLIRLGYTPRRAVAMIQSKRPGSLSNAAFLRYLSEA